MTTRLRRDPHELADAIMAGDNKVALARLITVVENRMADTASVMSRVYKNCGRAFVLEANPNPNLAYGEDFAESAEKAGLSYEALLQRIISLGLRYKAAWRT